MLPGIADQQCCCYYCCYCCTSSSTAVAVVAFFHHRGPRTTNTYYHTRALAQIVHYIRRSQGYLQLPKPRPKACQTPKCRLQRPFQTLAASTLSVVHLCQAIGGSDGQLVLHLLMWHSCAAAVCLVVDILTAAGKLPPPTHCC